MLPHIPGMLYDIHECFEPWALHIKRQGLRNAYGSTTDYMPIFQYILWIYDKLAGTEAAISANFRYTSCFVLIGDFVALWYVYKWIDKKLPYFALLSLCILNLGFSYDTILWGQIDGILCALIFISVYYAWKGNNLLGAISMVLAFNFKIQCIVIIPLWGLLMLGNAIADNGSNVFWRKVLLPVLAAATVQLVLIIPFMLGDKGPGRIFEVVIQSFSKYQSISIQASNIWQWLVQDKGNLIFASDAKPWIGSLTYKQAGLITFFTSSLFAMFPVLKLFVQKLKTCTAVAPSREMIWITGALVYLQFYFFNTEMHERYCQPAFLFIVAYAFFTRDFFPLVIFSIMNLLLLESSVHHFRLPNYETVAFDLRFLASLTAITIAYLYYRLYKIYRMEPATVAGSEA